MQDAVQLIDKNSLRDGLLGAAFDADIKYLATRRAVSYEALWQPAELFLRVPLSASLNFSTYIEASKR
jgi:hypothetical protein